MYQQLFMLPSPADRLVMDIEAVASIPSWLTNYVDWYIFEEDMTGISGEYLFRLSEYPRYKGYRIVPSLHLFIETTFIRCKGYLIPILMRTIDMSSSELPQFKSYVNDVGVAEISRKGWVIEYGDDQHKFPVNYQNLFLCYLSNMVYDYNEKLSVRLSWDSLSKTSSPLLVNSNIRLPFLGDENELKAQTFFEGCADTIVRELEANTTDNKSLWKDQLIMDGGTTNSPQFFNQLVGRPIIVSAIDQFNTAQLVYRSDKMFTRKGTLDLDVQNYDIHEVFVDLVRFCMSTIFNTFTFHAYITNLTVNRKSVDLETEIPYIGLAYNPTFVTRIKDKRLLADAKRKLSSIIDHYLQKFSYVVSNDYATYSKGDFDEVDIEKYANDIVVIRFKVKGNVVHEIPIDLLSYLFVYFV